MCGICGIVNLEPSEPADHGLVNRMNSALAHRGPDDAGIFLDGNVALGHRRLSIIDLAGGRQPIFNEDGSVVTVLNGEIYNYAALTHDLQARGHLFRTRSDTETIVHAYEEHGDRCVDGLRGMFAFALWDRRRRRLLLARDRLGKKPLYFHAGSGAFSFASEIKALLELPWIDRRVDPEALDLYLSLRYVPGPRTMFQGICKLQPGHLLVLDSNGVHIRRYWDVELGNHRTGSLESSAEQLGAILQGSVQLRMISEVPVGIFLSGGLDSSAVLAAMRGSRGAEAVDSYSVGYRASNRDERQSSEFEFARAAARAFGAEHHELQLTPALFRDALPTLVWHLDEPLADPSCIPLYFLSKFAREKITVVLSGEGADEILAGYGIYRRMLALEMLYSRFTPLSSWLAPRLSLLAPSPLARHYLNLAGIPLEARYRGVSRGVTPGLKARLFPHYSTVRSEDLLQQVFRPYFEASAHASPLDRMLYVDTKVWLPDDLLVKADKMTMATGMEQRVPFLDQRLVEFAFRLPAEFKLQQGQGKFLLRRLMSRILPGEILSRPKKGFPVPTRHWLGGPLRQFVRELLLDSDSACLRCFTPEAVREIVGSNERDPGSRHQDVWTLLVFEIWHRIFIERRLHPVGNPRPIATEDAV